MSRLRIAFRSSWSQTLIHRVSFSGFVSKSVFGELPLSHSVPTLTFSQSRWFASKKKEKASKNKKSAQERSHELQVLAQEKFDLAVQAEFAGRLAAAETLLLVCVALRVEAFGSDRHDHVVTALNALGNLYLTAQQPEQAVPYLERAVDASLVVHGEQNAENQIPSLVTLALALQRVATPDLARAESLLDRADAITARKFASSEAHPQKARRLAERAVLRHDQGRAEDARALFEQALEMRRRCLGDDEAYFEVLARRGSEGGLLGTLSDQEAAEAGDEPHPELAQSYGHLGMQRFAAGDFGAAEEPLRRAVHLQHVHAASYGLRPNFAAHEALAAALTQQGKLAAAQDVANLATELCHVRYGEDHPAFVLALLNEATILHLAAFHADLDAARRQHLQSHGADVDGGGVDGGGAEDGGRFALSGGELSSRAQQLLMSAFERSSEQYGLSHLVTLRIAFELADLLLARGGQRQAAQMVDEMLAVIAAEPVEEQISPSAAPSSFPSESLSSSSSLPTDSESLSSDTPDSDPSSSSSSSGPQLSVLPALSHASPFMAIYPSFPRQSRDTVVALLHRLRGQATEALKGEEGTSNPSPSPATPDASSSSSPPSASASASADWVSRARAYYERALELMRREVGDDHRYTRQLQYLLEKLPAEP